jgi:segregation and condensation protein B
MSHSSFSSSGTPATDEVARRFRHTAWLRLGTQNGAGAAPAAGAGSSALVREHLRGAVEAILFAAEGPMTLAELAKAAKGDRKSVKSAVDELIGTYKERGFRLDEVAGGYAFRTSPVYAPFVRDVVARRPVRMTRSQLETLAIIAYRQPITRPEVDDVRGVDSGAVLKALLDRDLIRILGKRDEPGRPLIYGTTPRFLEFFGLRALGDLPTLKEFTELSDESRLTFERELGEEPPASLDAGGLAGGEGAFSEVQAAIPHDDDEDDDEDDGEDDGDDDDEDDDDDDEDQ